MAGAGGPRTGAGRWGREDLRRTGGWAGPGALGPGRRPSPAWGRASTLRSPVLPCPHLCTPAGPVARGLGPVAGPLRPAHGVWGRVLCGHRDRRSLLMSSWGCRLSWLGAAWVRARTTAPTGLGQAAAPGTPQPEPLASPLRVCVSGHASRCPECCRPTHSRKVPTLFSDEETNNALYDQPPPSLPAARAGPGPERAPGKDLLTGPRGTDDGRREGGRKERATQQGMNGCRWSTACPAPAHSPLTQNRPGPGSAA